MRTTSILTFALATGIATFGCSAKEGARESTVRGTVALSTFASTPAAIAASNESGRVARALLDAQGRFALPLAKGHTYQLSVEGVGQSTPIVYPRASGKLDATFILKTNGASIALGQVRYHAAAPSTGFQVLSAALPSAPSGDCNDCVDDANEVTCEDSEMGTVASSGDDTAEQADPTGELATADQNAPPQVDGCDSQEGDDVDQEQEVER